VAAAVADAFVTCRAAMASGLASKAPISAQLRVIGLANLQVSASLTPANSDHGPSRVDDALRDEDTQ
jgi:hypothetical protein